MIRDVVSKLALDPAAQHLPRSLAQQLIARAASAEEERAFRDFCAARA